MPDNTDPACACCGSGSRLYAVISSRAHVADYCDRCVDEHTRICHTCTDVVHNTYVEGETRAGRAICRRCAARDNWFTCESCDCFRHGDDYAEYGRCVDCHADYAAHDDDDDDDGVGDYHSTRRRGFSPIEFPYPYSRRVNAYSPYGRPAPKTLFGLELEIESRSGGLSPGQIAARARHQLGSLFAGGERDGSLQHGVEIITHPATIDAHRQAWQRFDLRGSRAVSHDTTTCGLHVHFTRASVSQLTIAKVVQLFGDPSSTSTWSRVFRRNLNRYAESCRKPFADGSRLSANRYEVVNTTSNNTVEIRWARGTLQARTIVATLEIVHAAIRYCEQASTRALTAAAFIRWICADPWGRSETRIARRYLIDRGLVGQAIDPTARVRPGIASLPAALSDDAAPIPDATPARPVAASIAATAAAASVRLRRTSTPTELDPIRGVIQPTASNQGA